MSPDSPFAPVHSRATFVETVAGADTLRRLDDGLGAREPFLLVTGETGIGKTALAHEAVARWGSRVRAAFLAYPAQNAVELLEEVIRRFGAEPPEAASRPKLFACLERALEENTAAGQVAMIVVDDAHDLPTDLLEELRLLVNAAQKVQRPMEILLLGLPSLETRLDGAAFASLRQRVSVRAKLEPLGGVETKRYLHHRMAVAGGDGPGLFTKKTCREIAALTCGVPRQINALATEALRRTREAGETAIGPERVHIAAVALWGIDVPKSYEDDGDDDAPRAVVKPVPQVAPKPAPPPRAEAPPPPRAEVPQAPKSEPRRAEAPPAPKPAPPPAAEAPPREQKPTPPPVVEKPPVAAKPTPPPVVEKPPVAAKPAPAPAPVAESPPAAAQAAEPPRPPRVLSVPRRDTQDDYALAPSPPATHDPNEWVKRFVGDRGPLQIGSRSAEEPWIAEPMLEEIARVTGTPPPEPLPAELGPGEAPRPIDRRARPRKPKAQAPAAAPRPAFKMPAAAALVALIAVLAIVLVIRAGSLAKKSVPESSPPVLTAATRTDDSKTAKSTKTSKTARNTETRESAPVEASPDQKGPFTIDVGGYSELQTAIDERDRMQLLTGFEGWVIPADDGHRHRVVVGAYRNHARAASAASMLLRSRTLSRAVVVPLPPRDQRL